MGFWGGAAFGFGVKALSNSLRRLPLMNQPWEHVILAGLGGYAGIKYTELAAQTVSKEDQLLSMRASSTSN